MKQPTHEFAKALSVGSWPDVKKRIDAAQEPPTDDLPSCQFIKKATPEQLEWIARRSHPEWLQQPLLRAERFDVAVDFMVKGIWGEFNTSFYWNLTREQMMRIGHIVKWEPWYPFYADWLAKSGATPNEILEAGAEIDDESFHLVEGYTQCSITCPVEYCSLENFKNRKSICEPGDLKDKIEALKRVHKNTNWKCFWIWVCQMCSPEMIYKWYPFLPEKYDNIGLFVNSPFALVPDKYKPLYPEIANQLDPDAIEWFAKRPQLLKNQLINQADAALLAAIWGDKTIGFIAQFNFIHSWIKAVPGYFRPSGPLAHRIKSAPLWDILDLWVILKSLGWRAKDVKYGWTVAETLPEFYSLYFEDSIDVFRLTLMSMHFRFGRELLEINSSRSSDYSEIVIKHRSDLIKDVIALGYEIDDTLYWL